MKINKSFRLWIYPIIIVISVLLLSVLEINGSSVEIFRGRILYTATRDKDSLFGRPRAIRSDQYMVTLPMFVSEDINNEPTVNYDMGEGVNVITQNIPSRNIFSIFRLVHFPFFFTNDSGFSYSFFWWAEIGLLLISTYLLLLELTNKNLLISIGGSLLFVMTPFTQWWNQTNMIAWISFGLLFVLKILKEDNPLRAILYGIGLVYSIVTFTLFLYPAFQIPVTYVAAAVAIGVVLNDWKDIKKNLKTSIPVITISFLIGGLFVLLFVSQYKEVIDIISNTVYPGARFIQAGGGDPNWLFNGAYNILLQRDSNTAPFGNQSETSNFFLLFPPLIIWVIYKSILLYKKKKKVDWIAITLSLIVIFFTAFYFLPLPDFLSKISLMYLVPHQRLFIGFGFSSYLLMLYILSRKETFKMHKSTLDLIIGISLSILYGILIFFVGKNLFEMSEKFLNFPEFISPTMKIIGASLLSSLLIFLLLKNQRKMFLTFLLGFAFVSTAYINPIRKGLDVLINTPLADYITELSTKDDSRWIVYGDHTIAQYALANNAKVLNGVHIYPQFEIWKVLDPEGKYVDIYNRYAHIIVPTYVPEKELVTLVSPDALELNIDPCDERLKVLNVKYYISTKEILTNSCLTKLKQIDKIGIYIRND